MPTIETTPQQLKGGVRVVTNQLTTIRVNSPSLEILIGGPYRGNDGEMHTYGHAALRVITPSAEVIYDFGRYGNVTGDFGAEGEGILRVWDSFDSYITGENTLGRITTGFLYEISTEQASKIIDYYDKVVGAAKIRRPKHPNQKEYKLSKSYHAITNNCTTLTLDGARLALPSLESNAPSNNQGRGMSTTEKIAARAKNYGSWPSRIFMPADVKAMLEANQTNTPKRIKVYGGRKNEKPLS